MDNLQTFTGLISHPGRWGGDGGARGRVRVGEYVGGMGNIRAGISRKLIALVSVVFTLV